MRKVLYLLGQLSDEDVEWLIAEGAKQHLAAGTVLIHEGEPTQNLYIVLDGAMEVTRAGLGEEQPVRLGCGEVVGEMSFVDSRPPSATVAAADHAVVLALPHDRLAAKLASDNAFAAGFYRALAVFLSQRLRATMSRLAYDREQPLNEDADYEDELPPHLLDSVHRAGSRFDRVLQRLLAE